MASSDENPPVALAPPPWTCKCEAYWLFTYSSGPLQENAYSPLEAAHPPFSDPAKAGKFKGSLGMVQVLRYSETPAGSYDELLIIPGVFDIPGTSKTHSRVTRIYVSQRETTYNGRKNWNIPKHLARFSFTHPPTTSSSSTEALKVEVFPPEPAVTTPFFTATLQPFQWAPSFPLNTKYLPIDASLVQPPLPGSKKPGEEILYGTDRWVKVVPQFISKKARGMWVDVAPKPGKAQATGDASEPLLNGQDVSDWWPEFKPWKFGLWLEQTTLLFGEPESVG